MQVIIMSDKGMEDLGDFDTLEEARQEIEKKDLQELLDGKTTTKAMIEALNFPKDKDAEVDFGVYAEDVVDQLNRAIAALMVIRDGIGRDGKMPNSYTKMLRRALKINLDQMEIIADWMEEAGL